jgi:acyl-CoA synthetase (AMP-forming)/AMP-acid ligase II
MAHPGKNAELGPDGIALIQARTGETLTWSQLHEQAVQTANTFHQEGLRPGDSIALCLENRFEFVSIVWAAIYSGLRFTPISTRLLQPEIEYILADCDAKVLLHSEHTQVAGDAAMALDASPWVVNVDAVDNPLTASGDDAEPVYERSEGVPMLYSSGTTGRPKGVWRQAAPEPIEELQPADVAMAAIYRIDEDSVYLSTAPLYHSAPISFLVRMNRLGATTVIMDRFDPSEALASIDAHGVTHSQWVPTMFVRMLRLDDAERTAHDLSTHRVAVHGAAPCPIHVKDAMLDWWGPIIHEYYAGTEGAGTCLIGPDEWLTHKGSVGRSVSGPIHILDEHGQRLPPGEVGEIWFEASSDFRYLNDEAKTSQSKRTDGSGTFGDVGYLDADNYLYLTDRKAFTIISGGVNVYPQEIEDVLLAHAAVVDVAVFGVPHPEYGEEVKAVVQADERLEAGDALEAELLDHCRAHLSAFKCPRSVDFDPNLPREPNGKLMKRVLRDRYLERSL